MYAHDVHEMQSPTYIMKLLYGGGKRAHIAFPLCIMVYVERVPQASAQYKCCWWVTVAAAPGGDFVGIVCMSGLHYDIATTCSSQQSTTVNNSQRQ